MVAELDVTCSNTGEETLSFLYLQCQDGCPDTRACFVDVSWLGELEESLACLNASDQISKEGLCLCNTWYGFKGEDCSEFSSATWIMVSIAAVILLLAIAGLFRAITGWRRAKKKTPVFRNRFLLGLVSTAHCLIIAAEITDLFVIFNPQQLTSVYSFVLPLISSDNEFKGNPVGRILYPGLICLSVILTIIPCLMLGYFWISATIITGQMAPEDNRRLNNFKIFLKWLIGILPVVILFSPLLDGALLAYALMISNSLLLGCLVFAFTQFGSVVGKATEAVLSQIDGSQQDGMKRKTGIWFNVPSPKNHERKRSSGKHRLSNATSGSQDRPRTYSRYDILTLNKANEHFSTHMNLRSTTLVMCLGSLVGGLICLIYAILTSINTWHEYGRPGKISITMILFTCLPFASLIQLQAVTAFVIRSRRRVKKLSNVYGHGEADTEGREKRGRERSSVSGIIQDTDSSMLPTIKESAGTMKTSGSTLGRQKKHESKLFDQSSLLRRRKMQEGGQKRLDARRRIEAAQPEQLDQNLEKPPETKEDVDGAKKISTFDTFQDGFHQQPNNNI